MECYSALKEKKILIYATTGMNHEDMMLSETSQSRKDKYCMNSTNIRYLEESKS